MSKSRHRLLVVIASSVLVIAFLSTSNSFARSEASQSPPPKHCQLAGQFHANADRVRELVATPLQGFAGRLHLEATSRSGNWVHSPFSVAAVLGMAVAGAEKETAVEMARALGLPSPPDAEWHRLHGIGLASMLCPSEYDSVELDAANGLFPQQGKGLRAPFLKLLKEAYATEPEPLDYAKDPEAARGQINAWVGRLTRDKIPELIGPKSLNKATKLTLVNAVYLKGAWAHEFPKAATKAGSFHAPDGVRQVPMMKVSGSVANFSYAKFGDYAAASSKLNDGRTQFVVLLPDAGTKLSTLEERLSQGLVAKTLNGLKPQRLDLTLPRFKLTSRLGLVPALRQLGIHRLFEVGKAQLDPIDGGTDKLYVSQVVQQAVIDVNETGLEAAAATAMMMTAGSAPPKPTTPVPFVVNRPFLFLVHNSSTGAVLFMGRVEDPTRG